MKFSCEKETLLNLLNIASRAVTGKSSMPLLEGLLLAADADTLTITGYDLSHDCSGRCGRTRQNRTEFPSVLRNRAQAAAGRSLP